MFSPSFEAIAMPFAYQSPARSGALSLPGELLRFSSVPTPPTVAAGRASDHAFEDTVKLRIAAEPGFERRLIQRVKLFRFESKDVEAITTTKPINFFPA